MPCSSPRFRRRQAGAFTLIELLIVVAIIAILAAIAVPNFLDAQTRSKASRVKNDMRTIATALEIYRVDTNDYPTGFGLTVDPADRWRFGLWLLSTPIAYLSSGDIQDPMHDPQVLHPTDSTIQYNAMFNDQGRGLNGIFLSEFLRFTPQYMPTGTSVVAFGEGFQLEPRLRSPWWTLFSNGPDRNSGFGPTEFDGAPSPEFDIIQRVIVSDIDLGPFLNVIYDPTNGSVSPGNIWRAGGGEMNPAGRFVSQGR